MRQFPRPDVVSPRPQGPHQAALGLCRQNEVIQSWLSQPKEEGLEHDVVAEVLQLFDEDASGTVSVAELQAGMKSMGITMSEADMEILIAAFDESGDGQIDHEEITRRLECAGPCLKEGGDDKRQSAQTRQDDRGEHGTPPKIPRGTITRQAEYKRAFGLYDKEGSGRVHVHDLKSILQALSEGATQKQLAALVSQFAHGTAGFLELYAPCAHSHHEYCALDVARGIRLHAATCAACTLTACPCVRVQRRVFDVDGRANGMEG